tara:strand:- start:248794 stop:250920 length:2127 start_codon:yes stop_codon:yes gene_type:complete
LTLGIILGFSWSNYHYVKILAWYLPQEIVNKEVIIKGQVIEEVIQKNQNMKLTIQVTHLAQEALTPNRPKFEINWYKPNKKIKTGDIVEAIVKIKPIHGFSNPGSWDEEKFYFLKGVRAKASLRQLIAIESGHSDPIMAFRMKIASRLKHLFPDEKLLPVIGALTIGVKSDLPYDVRTVFQKTGTSHLLAISGLHIGLLATLCFFISRRIICLFPRLILFQPAMCWAAIITILASLAYALLAGFSLPTQRAFIMISVVMLGICFRQKVMSWQSYFIAMLLVILLNPLSVLQAGFWLSFLAVLSLMLVSHSSSKNKIIDWLKPQWAVFCMLIPLTILFFNMVSLISPIANMIAIPVVACIIVPLSLFGVFLLSICEPLAEFCLSIALSIFSYVWRFLDYISQVPFASFNFATPSMLALVLSVVGVILLLLPKGISGKRLALLLFLPLLLSKNQMRESELKVSVLDVGQGLSVVLQTKNHIMLYDTGPRFGRFRNAGNQIITPFLQAHQIHALDRILISHLDMDHRGGLSGLQDFKIADIQTSEPDKLIPSAILCEKGQSWNWDGVRFEILHPDGIEAVRNNRSCVLKVTANQQSILLSGDITQQVEKKLLHQQRKSLNSDILIVPHHGSRTSSSMDFIQAVAPEYAIYSVGQNNIYGLPKKEVLENYSHAGAKNLLTCQTGAIMFTLGRGAYLTPPVIWRDTAKRIWHK